MECIRDIDPTALALPAATMAGAGGRGAPPALGDEGLRRVVDAALDGMIVIDADATVLLYNAACERMFGYPPGEVLGRNVNRLMTPPDAGAHDRHIAEYLRTGRARVIGVGRDVRGRRKDGSTLPIRLSLAELRDAAGAAMFVATLHDLTETLRARARIEALQAELAQVARASAVGAMGSALAHELTQPLAAIAGFVEASAALIDQSGAGAVPAEVRGYMDQAVAQTLRAGAVVRLLREFTGRGETERSVEDLNAVVEEICGLAVLGTAPEGVELKLELAAGLPPVLIDPVQIQQVVLNLVRNGIDALRGHGGGTVTVATQRAGARVAVTVSDDGPGLPAEVRARVFEPFVSTKPDGVGIGLSICRTIAEAHGGTIAALDDAQAGRGAAFRLTVPVFAEPGG